MKEKEGGSMDVAGLKRGGPLADWDHLPDIGLYMDQIVTFLERQLSPYAENEGARVVTPSMINNYTKSGLIGKASAKKYSQSHVALLILVCTLKQVLSIPDLTRLLSGGMDEIDIASLYGSFRGKLALSMDETSGRIETAVQNLEAPARETALRGLALDFAVEAQARSLAARRILGDLVPETGKVKEMPKRRATRKKPEPSIE